MFACMLIFQALLIGIVLEAADKLSSSKPENKEKRHKIFEFIVALASTPAFPPDSLKQGSVKLYFDACTCIYSYEYSALHMFG